MHQTKCNSFWIYTGFPHFGQDEIPYLFQTISWPQDQFSLPICRIQVGNIGDYMRQNMAYLKIHKTKY